MLGTLIQGRVSVCGASITATKVALDVAVAPRARAAPVRPAGRRGGRCCSTTAPTSAACCPRSRRPTALHFAQERLVAQLHERLHRRRRAADRERRELETLAAGLKAIATWHATETIQECREACGGAGYLRSDRFAALKADTDVFTTFEGDNTVLLQLAAKNLLTDYRDQFGELDPLGLAAFVAGQVIGTIAERTAVREVLADAGDAARPRTDAARAAALAPGAHPGRASRGG